MADDVDMGTVRPHLQLIDRRRPECVAGNQQRGVSLLPKPLGQFCDGGGLADTVHSHGENDEGRGPCAMSWSIDALRRHGCPGQGLAQQLRTFSAAENSPRI